MKPGRNLQSFFDMDAAKKLALQIQEADATYQDLVAQYNASETASERLAKLEQMQSVIEHLKTLQRQFVSINKKPLAD